MRANDKVLDKYGVADILQVSPRKVLLLGRKKLLKRFMVGREVKFLQSDVYKFIQQGRKM